MHEVILPEGYKAFHSVVQRTQERIVAPIERRYSDVSYMSDLALLCQAIDRSVWGDEITRLRQSFHSISSYTNQSTQTADVRSHGDQLRISYQQSLADRSVYPALLTLLESEETKAGYRHGLGGGTIAESEYEFGDMQDVVESLRDLNPSLANRGLLIEEFKANPASINVNITKMRAFQGAGFDVKSPQYRLSLLTQLEYRARKHMLSPILDNIKRFSEEYPVRFLDTTNSSVPSSYAVDRLRKLLCGDSSLRFDGKGGSEWAERYYGTEYYRGLHENFAKNYNRLLKETYGDEASEAGFIIKSMTFMLTSQKGDSSVAELMVPVLKELANRDFDAAKIRMLELIEENSLLFYDFILEDLGFSPDEITTLKTRHIADLGKEQVRRALTKEEEKTRRREQSLQRHKEITAKKIEADNSEALWPLIEPYIGLTGVMHDPWSEGEEVIIVGRRVVKKKENRIGLYLQVNHVQYVKNPRTGEVKRVEKSSLHSYGEFLRRVLNGSIVFPHKENAK